MYDYYGYSSLELLYTTHMDQRTANRVNWEDVSSANLSNLWTTDYVHPEVEGEVAREEAGEVVDCLDDDGLFDFDWLDCP
jgi:hypothetical protein